MASNRTQQPLDIAGYEQLVRRMNVLSKSQTAFLKQYLHSKLAAGQSLVSKVIILLSISSNDSRIEEIQNALLALKLDEIEVDVMTTQFQFQEELSLLRGHVEKGLARVDPALVQCGTSAASSELVAENKELKAQIEKLKASLKSVDGDSELLAEIKDLKAQIEKLKASLKSAEADAVSVATAKSSVPALSSSAADQAEIKALKSKLEAAEDKISKLQSSSPIIPINTDDDKMKAKMEEQIKALNATIASKDDEIADKARQIAKVSESYKAALASNDVAEGLQEEIETLKAEVKDRLELYNKMKKEADDKVDKMRSEMDEKIRETEAKGESEKEIMMEAMGQEVDEIEKAKNLELTNMESAKNEEIDKLLNENKTLLDKYKKLQDTSVVMNSKFVDIQVNARKLSNDYKSTVEATKSDLNEFKLALKAKLFGSIMAKMKKMDEQAAILRHNYKKELDERKKLHNMVQDLKGNIRVFMRCRPPTAKEIEQFGHDSSCVSFPAPGEVRVFNEKNREKVWEFDETFDTNSTQDQVYREVSGLVTSVMDGYNVCIFAYGQTGSGKTWTMSGPASNRGVNTRALDELFAKSVERNDECKSVIMVSILEVYNEEIRDLLVDSKSKDHDKLEVRIGDRGNHVPGLTHTLVDNLQSVIDLMTVADKNRASATTNMNEHSSRSHMMLTVTVTSENVLTGVTTRGKMNLVDLAGSERLNKSGAAGVALKEAQNINKSLSALGDVIAARANKQAHVPFRNSTLTYLLQDSLSHDSKTLMIVCVSPVLYNSEETFCSLTFASRVRTVELGKATKTTLDTSAKSAPVKR